MSLHVQATRLLRKCQPEPSSRVTFLETTSDGVAEAFGAWRGSQQVVEEEGFEERRWIKIHSGNAFSSTIDSIVRELFDRLRAAAWTRLDLIAIQVSVAYHRIILV